MRSRRLNSFVALLSVSADTLTGKMALLCCCAILLLTQLTDARAAGRCVSPLPPEDAYRHAAAVFLGEAVEVKEQAVHTRAGSRFPYQETTLRVVKSWKLIDRQEVTVTTSPAHYERGCFTFKPGERYVVYAAWAGDTLYASLRTGNVEDAASDLEMLGDERLTLKHGKFRNYTTFTYVMITFAALVLLLGGYVYRLTKRPLRAD
jgi:hypothetical protein